VSTHDPLRVMAVINGLGTGGAERSLAEILPGLRKRGIEVQVVCSYRRERGVEIQVVAGGFRVTYLERSSYLGRWRELRRLIRSERPDLVHTTIIESDILGRLAAAGSGVPVVTSLVNTSYDSARLADPSVRRHRLELVRIVDGFTARHLTSAFHAITQAVATDAVRALRISPARVTVFGRGRDLTRLGQVTPERRAEVRQRLGLDPNDVAVIAVGRQEFQKGHHVLVDAAASLHATFPRLRVIIAGREGSETGRIRHRITELGLEDVVWQLGHRDDVPDLLAASDVFAFPSRFEGLGGSLLEALALGLPCVVSDIPVFREVGGEHVRFAEVGNPDAWAESISGLIHQDSGSCAGKREYAWASYAVLTDDEAAELTAEWLRESSR
jgi:glycosyltransferase involved in cell wall biosynthesis